MEKPIRNVNARAIFFPPFWLSVVFFIMKKSAAAKLPKMSTKPSRTIYFMTGDYRVINTWMAFLADHGCGRIGDARQRCRWGVGN